MDRSPRATAAWWCCRRRPPRRPPPACGWPGELDLHRGPAGLGHRPGGGSRAARRRDRAVGGPHDAGSCASTPTRALRLGRARGAEPRPDRGRRATWACTTRPTPPARRPARSAATWRPTPAARTAWRPGSPWPARARRGDRDRPTARSCGWAAPAPDAPGYDLRGFVVGSEGTLGVVTEVCVRLMRNPPAVRTMLLDFPTVRRAAETVSGIIAAGVDAGRHGDDGPAT